MNYCPMEGFYSIRGQGYGGEMTISVRTQYQIFDHRIELAQRWHREEWKM